MLDLFEVNPFVGISRPKTPQRGNIREFVYSCASRFYLPEPIVDVACGYRNNFPEISAGLARQARIKFQYFAFDRISDFDQPIEGIAPKLVADAQAMPFKTGSIGTVICTEVLEHVRDYSRAMSEMSRVLQAGGRLILTVPGKDIPKHEKLPHQLDYRRFTLTEVFFLLLNHDLIEVEISDRLRDEKQLNILACARKS